jgi:hypothetical protein
MAAIRIGQIAQGGFGALFNHLDAALRLAWLPVVIATVAQALLPPLLGNYLNIDGGEYPTGHELQIATLVIVWLAAYGALAHRWIAFLLPASLRHADDATRSRALSRDILMALFLALWTATSVGALIGTLYVTIELSASGADAFAALAFFGLSITAMLLLARLMPLLPMIALGEGVRVVAVWRLTRGSSWRLLLGFALTLLLILFIWLGAGMAVGLAFRLIEIAGPGGVVVDRYLPLFVHNVIGGACYLILLGAFAEAYRLLDGPGLGVAEELLAVFDD